MIPADVIPVSALTAPRPRWWHDPYGTLLRCALVIGWIPGFTLGLVLMLELAVLQRAGAAWWPHAQTHGHAQVYGFAGLFFFGVATQILPRFLGQPLRNRPWVSFGGLLVALGLMARLVLQPFASSGYRSVGLAVMAGVEVAGVFMVLLPFARAALGSQRPREAWQLAMGLGFLSWAIGGIVSAWIALAVLPGALLVPQPLDELSIALGLWGFIVPVTLAVGTQVFPNFLLLKPAPPWRLTAALAVYLGGLLLVALSWLVQLLTVDALGFAQQLRAVGWALLALGGGGYAWALRVFEAPARLSVSPHITHPTRLWFRIAYGYLLFALGLGVWFAVIEGLTGVPPAATALSAQRHALAMGYLMPLIIGMAGRILPELSGEMTRRPRVLGALVWLWISGAGLRVVGELWGGYSGPGTLLMTAGAVLAFIGFAWFSVRLWASIGRRRLDALG